MNSSKLIIVALVVIHAFFNGSVATAQNQNDPLTPKVGSQERGAILDVMRKDFYPSVTDADVNSERILFDTRHIKIKDEWACVHVVPLKDGKPYAEPRWALLHNINGAWHDVNYFDAIRPFTSEEEAMDAEDMTAETVIKIRRKFPTAPAEIFPHYTQTNVETTETPRPSVNPRPTVAKTGTPAPANAKHGPVAAEGVVSGNPTGAKATGTPYPALASDQDTSITGAKLIEFGLFDISRTGRVFNAPDATTGVWSGTSSTRLLKKTNSITPALETHFGILYVVTGEVDNAEVEVTVQITHPKIVNPESGEITTVDAYKTKIRIGQRDYRGYTFDHKWEMVSGKWVYRIFTGSKLLLEKAFDVHAPQ